MVHFVLRPGLLGQYWSVSETALIVGLPLDPEACGEFMPSRRLDTETGAGLSVIAGTRKDPCVSAGTRTWTVVSPLAEKL